MQSQKQIYKRLNESKIPVKFLSNFSGYPRFKHLIYYSILFTNPKYGLTDHTDRHNILFNEFEELSNEYFDTFIALCDCIGTRIFEYKNILTGICKSPFSYDITDPTIKYLYNQYNHVSDHDTQDNILDNWILYTCSNFRISSKVLRFSPFLNSAIDDFLNVPYVQCKMYGKYNV